MKNINKKNGKNNHTCAGNVSRNSPNLNEESLIAKAALWITE